MNDETIIKNAGYFKQYQLDDLIDNPSISQNILQTNFLCTDFSFLIDEKMTLSRVIEKYSKFKDILVFINFKNKKVVITTHYIYNDLGHESIGEMKFSPDIEISRVYATHSNDKTKMVIMDEYEPGKPLTPRRIIDNKLTITKKTLKSIEEKIENKDRERSKRKSEMRYATMFHDEDENDTLKGLKDESNDLKRLLETENNKLNNNNKVKVYFSKQGTNYKNFSYAHIYTTYQVDIVNKKLKSHEIEKKQKDTKKLIPFRNIKNKRIPQDWSDHYNDVNNGENGFASNFDNYKCLNLPQNIDDDTGYLHENVIDLLYQTDYDVIIENVNSCMELKHHIIDAANRLLNVNEVTYVKIIMTMLDSIKRMVEHINRYSTILHILRDMKSSTHLSTTIVKNDDTYELLCKNERRMEEVKERTDNVLSNLTTILDNLIEYNQKHTQNLEGSIKELEKISDPEYMLDSKETN